jgi:putative oxidoreductase
MGFFTGMLHIPASFAVLAIAAEFLGGLGLIFGLFTRVAAFGIFCNMAVAVAMIHHQFGLFMNWTGTQKEEGFEFHLLALAITVFLMIRGAGAVSADRLWTSPLLVPARSVQYSHAPLQVRISKSQSQTPVGLRRLRL